MSLTDEEVQALIDEATYDYVSGDTEAAESKLVRASSCSPQSFAAWHALAEVYLSVRRLNEALAAAERGHALRPNDLLINTTLSRIWMERGDKARAEHFGAQARMQSWKEELRQPPSPEPGKSPDAPL